MSKLNYCSVCHRLFIGDHCDGESCSTVNTNEIKVAEDTMFEKEISSNIPDEDMSKIIPGD